MSLRASWLLLAFALACRSEPTTAPEPANTPEGTAARSALREPPPVDLERLRGHLAFLADDAQEGRPPGTAADQRVEAHIEQALRQLGLQPGFGDSFRQSFEFTDGVTLRAGEQSALQLGGKPILHTLVPFSADSAAPVSAKIVYVGHGIPGDTPDSGDYAKILDKVKGAIVVARSGAPDDPHLDPAKTRVQSKVIAARDRGAVGFVLWEPDATAPYPNHGEANDLQLPALAVSAAGTPDLLKAFGKKGPVTAENPHGGLKVGAVGRGSLHSPVQRVTATTANVAGLLQGTGRKRIVLGAHMDHLGHGTNSSLAPGVDSIHNGADDNASGVAALLGVAAALAQLPPEARPFDIQFVAFAAEEMGLLGSKRVVESLSPEARQDIVAMLNFDMVGRVRDNTVVVVGTGTSSVWPGLLERAKVDPRDAARTLVLKPSEDGFGASDQASYYAADIPVLHFFSGAHDDYHRPTDDFEKINLEGATAIADLSVRLVALMLREQPVLDFKKIAAAAPRAGGFRVSLGTVPDYAANADGMKLSGVRPQSPAEAAGLKAGDVIVQIGKREIHNIDDYMASFAELQPAVAVPIVVVREGARVELSITPAAPTRR
ncbi:M20/M25/M40 family metallo-hydrolase [Nannocystis bainbridge]|uniref:M20/M25/M40 family metallo-hydrolase n=1 Tax=Nannocystis bainbridge TaxID=2995303 RepID=A0ABT5E1N1_9BACT|nr:M20/M25/M40 family metallo-hydrolase [Nannocystis bainbridge]MDC0719330.1 M20/M25/M40 family metallo-hydrolase [Nannocystis bainbridge]